MWQGSLVASEVTWWPLGPGVGRGSVAALTVSYNTRELTAFLLWSLRTIVSWPQLEIVVVDNGSRDGSAQLLAEAERRGVCALLANDGTPLHLAGTLRIDSWQGRTSVQMFIEDAAPIR